jgi:branched-chain amino acid transport system substrate-binding protein
MDEKTRLATFHIAGIATGGGAVWATDPLRGALWRIDPGEPLVTRTIPVGVGAWGIAFGEGAVWVANTLDGSVLRVDPWTNRVVSRISVGGAPREIAVGNGRVWVTVGPGSTAAVSGAPQAEISGVLPSSICGPVSYGGAGSPQFLIASDLPLQSGPRGSTFPMTQAIAFVLARHGFRAGKYTVGYQSCDDATVQAGGSDPAKCVGNAKAFAAARKLVGVIGTYHSSCAALELPILNRAPHGPVPMISPANSWPGLTRRTHESVPGEPKRFYPTGVRHYARVSPSDDYQGAAHALLARQLGLKRLFVLRGTVGRPWPALLAGSFERAGSELGLRIVGSATWDAGAPSYRPLVAKVRQARPDGVFLGGVVFDRAGPLLKELRAALGPNVKFLAPDGFAVIPYLRQVAGSAADGMYVSVLGAPNSALGPAGQRFLEEFVATQPGGVVPSFTAAYAAQAAEILLAAIARSDGTRASVARELLTAQVENGILGTFRIDRNGDPTLQAITILRVTGERTPSPTLLGDHVGTVIDRVLTPPTNLVRP